MSRRDSYAAREHARNRAYKEAYQSEEFIRWVASLTPEQRENAERLGLLTYQLDKESSGRSSPRPNAACYALSSCATTTRSCSGLACAIWLATVPAKHTPSASVYPSRTFITTRPMPSRF